LKTLLEKNLVMPSMAVRIKTEDMNQSMAALQEKWASLAQGDFNYSFLDQDLQKQYEADRSTAWLFDIFTYIAIIMCCTGLFGLTTYLAQQRRKEMSIRKILGASVSGIMLTFSKEFILLILLAFAIGMPVAYWAMNEWLSNFAYHVDVSASIFIIAAVIMVLLLLLTVSYQSIKLAHINPAESLRNE